MGSKCPEGIATRPQKFTKPREDISRYVLDDYVDVAYRLESSNVFLGRDNVAPRHCPRHADLEGSNEE